MKLGEEAYRLAGEPRCLECGEIIDAATAFGPADEEKRGPRAGDIAICLGCGHVMIYADEKGAVRQLTDEEMIELAGDERIVKFNTVRGPALAKAATRKPAP